jgi:hypothetical protein
MPMSAIGAAPSFTNPERDLTLRRSEGRLALNAMVMAGHFSAGADFQTAMCSAREEFFAEVELETPALDRTTSN